MNPPNELNREGFEHMNFYNLEILVHEKHRSMLVEADLRRRARRLPQPARSGMWLRFRRPRLLPVALPRVG